jgi:hypothetical protein
MSILFTNARKLSEGRYSITTGVRYKNCLDMNVLMQCLQIMMYLGDRKNNEGENK